MISAAADLVATGRQLVVAVGRERPGLAVVDVVAARHALGDDEQQTGGGDGGDDLHDDVRQHLFGREALGGPQADGDGGVEVPARDVADGVGHGEHGETERERHTEEAEPERVGVAAELGGQHGGTAAAEHQPERADRFGDELLAHLHGAPFGTRCRRPSTTAHDVRRTAPREAGSGHYHRSAGRGRRGAVPRWCREPRAASRHRPAHPPGPGCREPGCVPRPERVHRLGADLRRPGGGPGPAGRVAHRRPRSAPPVAARVLPAGGGRTGARALRGGAAPRRTIVLDPPGRGLPGRRRHLHAHRQLPPARGVRGTARARRSPPVPPARTSWRTTRPPSISRPGPFGTTTAPATLAWMRAVEDLGDDPVIHACALAYLSDEHLLGAALTGHSLAGDWEQMMTASLDHAIWFHRPVRADEWLCFVLDGHTMADARGLARWPGSSTATACRWPPRPRKHSAGPDADARRPMRAGPSVEQIRRRQLGLERRPTAATDTMACTRSTTWLMKTGPANGSAGGSDPVDTRPPRADAPGRPAS